ncbi:hypothetical protein CLU79DRAFT_785415 [Phycomyces nitens]|nr:hypothetical protein CLU79DRAFT_785415 [Phycomyces nitens]
MPDYLPIKNANGKHINLLNDQPLPKSSENSKFKVFSNQSTEDQTSVNRRRYHCPEPMCDKSFTTSGHLARHNRIHTGEKNFQCLHPGCLSRFSRQDNMMQHYRTHISPKSRRHSHQRYHNSFLNHPYHKPLQYHSRLHSDNPMYLSENQNFGHPHRLVTAEPTLGSSSQYNTSPRYSSHVAQHQVYHTIPPHSTYHGYHYQSRSIDSSPHGVLSKPQPIEPSTGSPAGHEANSHPRSVSSSPSTSSSPFLFSPLQFHDSPPLQMAPYQPPDSALNYQNQSRPQYSVYQHTPYKNTSFNYYPIPCAVGSFA